MRNSKSALRKAAVWLTAVLIICMSLPLGVSAKGGERKKVRAGWHEPPHFMTDQNGRKSGYSYEYQRKVAAYTGWEYEYVDGTWTDLMEMLKKGEIDILSDVSYKEERTKDMLFTSIPMGTEVYYVFVSTANKEKTSNNLSSLNGKKIGMTEGSIQKYYFIEWEKAHGIQTEIVEMNCDEEELIPHLDKTIDAIVTTESYATTSSLVPVAKIGSSEFFFAVNKNRPDLRDELDDALNKIQNENSSFNQKLYDKYLKNTQTKRFLNDTEKKWLAKHGKIRVGYQDNYLAFCARDKASGELTGALKDYLDYAASAFEDTKIEFEAVAYPSASDAIMALKKGEIDCVFPANLTDNDAEQLDLVMTPALMQTEMDAVIRTSEQKEFLKKEHIKVAVNEGNPNYDLFLAEHYPDWERVYFKDTPAGLDAVAKGDADCVIISSFRYGNISKQCKKLNLTTVYTGVDMDYCFAVNEGETELYTVLSRVTAVVPPAMVHSALTYYSTEEAKSSLGEIILDNLLLIIIVVTILALLIADLVLHNLRAQRQVQEKDNQVKDLNRKAFVDSLTSVRNHGAFAEYVQRLQERVNKEDKFEYAMAVFDCNYLKKINDLHGHDKGDIYLKNACRLICNVFEHSPVFRIGGDEFAAVLMNDDLKNREKLILLFEEKQTEKNSGTEDEWEQIHVAYGIAVYDPSVDGSVEDTIRRADRAMYEYKAESKARDEKKEEQ